MGIGRFCYDTKKGKLTPKEMETVDMMKQVLQAQPKFMSFTFKEDGTLLAEPKTEDSDANATWKLKNNILSITSGKKKKTEEYTLKLLDNGNLELKAKTVRNFFIKVEICSSALLVGFLDAYLLPVKHSKASAPSAKADGNGQKNE